MGNIWKIFSSDIKRLVRNIFALIIAVGICALPSLYAWFNIYSNWDPYANTANIKVAVATEDKDYTASDGTVVNMGNEVIDELKENKKIGWVFLDAADEAVEGVSSGKYYAAVVIGSNFTESMYNVFKQDFKNPTITYYENEKKNAVATKITDTAVSTLKQSINEKFIEVVTSSIFEKTNSLTSDVENKDVIQVLVQKLTEINSNIASYNNMIDSFIAGNEKLTSSVNSANNKIPGLRKKISNASNSMSAADASLGTSKTTLADFSANVQSTLSAIETSINTVSTDINNAGLADKAQKTADSINQTTTDTATLVLQLNTLYDTLSKLQQNGSQTADTKQQIQQVMDTISSIRNGAGDIQNVLNGVQTGTVSSGSTAVKDAVNTNINSVTQALSSCSQSVENIKNMYANNLVPQMNGILDSMSQILTNVTNLLNNLDNTLGDMSTVLNGVEDTVSGADSSLEQIQTVLKSVSDKLTTVINKVNAAKEDEKVQTLLEVFSGNPEAYGKFFAEPVEVAAKEVYPIENYGSAVAPFYTVLALWVGALILVSIIKVKAEPRNIENLKSYQLFFGRYLFFFTMGQLQAAIVVLGNLYLLHCQVLYPFQFWFAASLTSLTFTLLIYALTLSFGDIGKALAVVIMVIQIAGSGGTYPIEILPAFYRNVYIFFPFPYAINAMRETVSGMYGNAYEKSIAQLLIFAGVGLLIGIVIRIPFVGLNHFVEKRMKDMKMM